MNKSNVAAGIVCFAIGAFAFWLSGSVSASTFVDPLGGRFFPRMIASLFMVASGALVVTGMMGIEISGGTAPRPSSAAQSPNEPAPLPTQEVSLTDTRLGRGEARQLGFLTVMIAYTFAMPIFGYIFSSLLVFAALITIAGEHRPLRVLLGSTGLTAALYIIFAVVLGMNVPQSSLF